MDVAQVRKSNYSSIILASIIFLVLGLALGLYLVPLTKNQTGIINQPKEQDKSLLKVSPLIKSQTANASGNITKVDGNKITISNGGVEDTFSLAPKFAIFKPSVGKQATPSTQVNDIETGKDATIILQVKDSEYKIISISYTGK